ncbi:MAG: twin-arginine translocation signal domain-containing protein, partial [Pyrinomonadaceae bacterium]|nr:twin-arginine translocation signal domain-containing protein [Pyrinomonadaceae bacterium]
MDQNSFSRREMLRAAAVIGAAGAVGIESVTQIVAASVAIRTPPILQNDMTAVDAALGKKGRYVEAESVYT